MIANYVLMGVRYANILTQLLLIILHFSRFINLNVLSALDHKLLKMESRWNGDWIMKEIFVFCVNRVKLIVSIVLQLISKQSARKLMVLLIY